jgi:diacylglycerol kinase
MKNSLLNSFGFAFKGISTLLLKERNFRIHCAFFILVICAGLFFKITSSEWLAVLGISALVISLEALNTSIEKLCDLYSTEKNQSIEKIKDIAAGSVLISAIFAVIIGMIIFIPYIVTFFAEK